MESLYHTRCKARHKYSFALTLRNPLIAPWELAWARSVIPWYEFQHSLKSPRHRRLRSNRDPELFFRKIFLLKKNHGDLRIRRQNPYLCFLLKHCITPCLWYDCTGPRIGGSAAFKQTQIDLQMIYFASVLLNTRFILYFINISILQDILHHILVFPTTNHWTIKPNVKDEKTHHDLLSPYATGIFGATYFLLSFLSELRELTRVNKRWVSVVNAVIIAQSSIKSVERNALYTLYIPFRLNNKKSYSCILMRFMDSVSI